MDRIVRERRRQPRHLVEAQVAVLFPEYYLENGEPGILGWTVNVSEGGVCFCIADRILQQELILHIDYEGMGAEYLLARVVEERKCPEEGWLYHCKIERTLSSIGILASLED